MSINTREDANKYYQLVNELVDEYITKWKIRPSNLGRYLKPGSERFTKFLEKNKLKEIKGAERVLRDVIEDRTHMERDGVITFENFNLMESVEWKVESLKSSLWKGIEKADIKSEKVLADYFDTNLGDIDIVDSEKHLFKVNNWKNEPVDVVVYSKEDVDVIKYNMIDFLFLELTKKSIEIVEGIEVNLSDMVKSNMFEEKMSQLFEKDNILLKTISKCLGFNLLGENNGYFIWVSEIM